MKKTMIKSSKQCELGTTQTKPGMDTQKQQQRHWKWWLIYTLHGYNMLPNRVSKQKKSTIDGCVQYTKSHSGCCKHDIGRWESEGKIDLLPLIFLSAY